MAEAELALELEYMMRRLGAEAAAFDPIVGSGPRGALPHAIPSDRKIQAGDFIVIDMGCVYQGYCSDLTRTFVVGRPEPKQLEIYNIVLEAQTAALNVLKPGLTGREVDSAARDVIRRAGYDRNFGHSLAMVSVWRFTKIHVCRSLMRSRWLREWWSRLSQASICRDGAGCG